MIKDLDRPNGIAFSQDEKIIYIADTGEGIKHLYAYELDGHDNLINKKLIYDFKPFFSDGFRSDKDGNIWTSAGKGIKCSLLMSKASSLYRCLSKSNFCASNLLIQLNNEICETI